MIKKKQHNIYMYSVRTALKKHAPRSSSSIATGTYQLIYSGTCMKFFVEVLKCTGYKCINADSVDSSACCHSVNFIKIVIFIWPDKLKLK